MKRILITGGSGFIGAHLARMAVGQDYNVTCLVRNTSPSTRLDGLAVRRAYGDVTDRESLAAAIRGQDVVFHLAGCVKAIQPRRFYEINEEGTRNIAEACAARSTPPVLIVVSSLSAAGPSTPEKPRREGDPPSPVSHYGRSKLAAENAARKLADSVPTTIVRPPVVFGEGDAATYELYRLIARWGIHVVPSWREHRLSLIHVEDLVSLLLLAAKGGKRLPEPSQPSWRPGEGCYFAAGERDVSFAEWGRMIGHALGRRKTRIVRVGPAIRWSVACIATAMSIVSRRPSYFTIDKAREAGAGSWTCSAESAATDLGFKVGATLRERTQQTARCYLDEACFHRNLELFRQPSLTNDLIAAAAEAEGLDDIDPLKEFSAACRSELLAR